MSISKKGTRKIIVDEIEYLYKVSKPKKKSDWREQENEVNETFIEYASYFGLGKVKDITINIVVQLYNKPVSSLFVKCHSILIDGFMGAEQIMQITPKLVSNLILEAINDDWDPFNKRDYRMNIVEQNSKNKEPIILKLPDMGKEVGNYQNLDKPYEIKLN